MIQTEAELSNREETLNTIATNSSDGYYFNGHPLSPDMRIRIAHEIYENQNDEGDIPFGTISVLARKYGVSRRTVGRIKGSLFDILTDNNDTNLSDLLFGGFPGSLNPRRKIDDAVMSYILLLLNQKPWLYLHEITELLELHLGVSVTSQWIGVNLHRWGFSKKKFSRYHERRYTPANIALRQNFKQTLNSIPIESIFFFDESGFKDSLRTSGWSNQNRLYASTPYHSRGPQYNLLAVIGVSGFIACSVSRSTTKGIDVCNFFADVVLDVLPGLAGNVLAYTLAMKNCSLLYLPSHSPDLNPIENAFGTVKYFLKDWISLTKEYFLKQRGQGISKLILDRYPFIS